MIVLRQVSDDGRKCDAGRKRFAGDRHNGAHLDARKRLNMARSVKFLGQVESTRQLVARSVAREEMKRRVRAPPGPSHLFCVVRHGKRKEKTVAGVRIRENFYHVTRVRPTQFRNPRGLTAPPRM